MLLLPVIILAQEPVMSETEQQLENLTAANEDNETEDDSYLQQLQRFKNTPLNLNAASAEDLRELLFLSDYQIAQFIQYKLLLGPLNSLYEMQAIPGWDIGTIKKILPFVTIEKTVPLPTALKQRLRHGDNTLLYRYSQVLEKSRGYRLPKLAGTNFYVGERDRHFLRFNYNYKNVLSWGLVADKDAGESFFRNKKPKGFDFYSFHFYARNIGKIKTLAIGDFSVNMGQGLLQWQSLAFRKSAAVLAIKRQAAVFRPYNSPAEYNFHRGVAITAALKKWEWSVFASRKKISANINADTLSGNDWFSSILAGGYHRTAAELLDRNSITQLAAGGVLRYQSGNARFSFNTIHHWFSNSFIREPLPYNLYTIKGKNLHNYSVDYNYTFKNIHFFGETAIDGNRSLATVNGALISLDAKAEMSLLYRNINKAYQSLNGDAFTESSVPVNEKGIYAAISLRPTTFLRLDAYADFYRFPWLKYRIDAPSSGKDFLAQLTYLPSKQIEVYLRYRTETRQQNKVSNTLVNPVVAFLPKHSLRWQNSISLNPGLILRSRVELLWYNKEAESAEEGFLLFADAFYRPTQQKWAANFRLQFFETASYNSRIYAYENDVLYGFSIPAFYDRGVRYYLNFNAKDFSFLSKRTKKRHHEWAVWLKWAQTVYSGKNAIGSGLDELTGNTKSELRLQGILSF